MISRFSGFLRMEKLLKQLLRHAVLTTGLKPGANEKKYSSIPPAYVE